MRQREVLVAPQHLKMSPLDPKRLIIENLLIPFILRDQGRGFSMETWKCKIPANILQTLDGISRRGPTCGTVCCIGGTLCYFDISPQTIGLNKDNADALFYGWESQGCHFLSRGRYWRRSYRIAFKKAKTTLEKAKVAVQLLRDFADGKKVFCTIQE